MAIFQFAHECAQQPYSDLICSLIVVSVFREIAGCLEVNDNSALVTDCFYFCIFNRAQGIYYM